MGITSYQLNPAQAAREQSLEKLALMHLLFTHRDRDAQDAVLAVRSDAHREQDGRIAHLPVDAYLFIARIQHTIDLVNRGEIWSTDAYETPETPAYPLEIRRSTDDVLGNRLVVTIGILRDIVTDVNASLPHLGLEELLEMFANVSATYLAIEHPVQHRDAQWPSQNQHRPGYSR